MSKYLRGIAIFQVFAGLVAAIYYAKVSGIVAAVAVAFSVFVVVCLFFAAAEHLDNQERIIEKIGDAQTFMTKTVRTAVDTWECSCGYKNPKSVKVCKSCQREVSQSLLNLRH